MENTLLFRCCQFPNPRNGLDLFHTKSTAVCSFNL